jgi:hypothetical protein
LLEGALPLFVGLEERREVPAIGGFDFVARREGFH